MLIVTTDTIVGREIKEVKGMVKGSIIQTKHIGKDILSSLKNVVGGELTEYNQMLEEARKIAIGRMIEDAEALGANAIVGVRLHSSTVAAGAAEMIAYGTGVYIE